MAAEAAVQRDQVRGWRVRAECLDGHPVVGFLHELMRSLVGYL